MATTAAVLSYDEIMEQLSSFELEDDMELNYSKLSLKYSERNTMLILMQHPTATECAGYSQWQAAKRQVRKGEKAIKILAPAGKKKDKITGEETDQMLFRIASIFAQDQLEEIA